MGKLNAKKFLARIGILDVNYLRDFVRFSFGFFISAFLSLITVSLVNSLLGPEELGRYSYLKSIFDLAFGILSLNIYSSYLRFNTKGDNVSLKLIVQRIVLISSLLLLGIIYYYSKSLLAIFYCLVIVFNERVYYFRSLMNIRKLNIARIIPAFMTLLVIAFLGFYSNISSNYIFFAYGVGYSIVFFLFRKTNSIKIVNVSISSNEVFRYSIPIAALVIVDWVLNLSAQILIKQYFDYVELASYAIAQRALLAVKLFSGLFLMFYPMIYFKEVEKGNFSFVIKSRLLIIILLLLLCVFIFLGSKYIYIVMGASKYLEHIYLFKILLIAEFFKVVASFYGLYLSYSLKTLTSLIILAVGAGLNILLLFLFLKDYGVIFAAFSTLLSMIFIFILMFFFSMREEKKYFKSRL